MKKYISPLAIENDILAEAIYAASGIFPDTPDKPGDNTPDNPGDNTPDNPGDNTPDNPGDNTPDNPGDNTPDNPGDNTPDNPGDNTPDNPGDNTPDNPGDNTPDNPGDNTPETPSDNPVKDYDYDTECWTLNPSINQVVTLAQDPSGGNYANLGIYAVHPRGLQHISSQTVVVLTFNRPIASAEYAAGTAEVNGDTVTLTRTYLADAYNSGDQFNANLRIEVPKDTDIDGLEIMYKQIACTHAENVQGGFD